MQRSLVWLFLIFGFSSLLGCSSSDDNYGENREAALLALSRGGEVRVDVVTYPIKSRSKLPDADFLVTSLNLSETKFSDLDAQKLSLLSELHELNLYSTQVTDKGMKYLVPLSQLENLELSYTSITDAGLEELSGLKNLKQLYLHGVKISEDALKQFEATHKSCKVYY